jgi:crotonobetainyl-CoA:carnitine CoA-transferase CaiB-like acyl-CoA transferase
MSGDPGRGPGPGLLAPYRVLEITDGRGALTGLILAQLGARVTLVESPHGGPLRRVPPLAGPDASVPLAHLVLNRGKRSVVWNPADPAALHGLLTGADALITSGGPRELAACGLPAIDELQRAHPGLVIASISGFGLTGPKADWHDADIVCGAAGLQMSLTGDADRPPLRCAVPQVFAAAAADAAVGVLVALAERERSGRGQLIDCSAQESWIWMGFYHAYSAAWGSPVSTRNGASPRTGVSTVRFDFPAADGHVTATVLFGDAVGPYTNRLVAWMAEEDECPPDLAATDWAAFNVKADPERQVRLNDAIAAFTSRRTRAELLQGSQARRLLLAPALTLSDVLRSAQFAERGLWRDLELTPGRTVRIPGPIARSWPTPFVELAPAPALGDAWPSATDGPSRAGGPLPEPAEGGSSLPLEGLKVLDLTTSFAGPLATRTLAAFGARVVKVESERRPDLSRTTGPFLARSIDGAAPYAHTNAGKWSIALDLTQPAASRVLHDLVAWADVIVDAYAPGALARMGLDEATVRRLNPGAVVLQSTMVGQTGPLSSMPGYGNMASALCGFFTTTAWPDRAPVGPVGAYTDMMSPRLSAAAVLAALDHRRRTGEGTWIDLGQGEACMQMLALGLADTQLGGRSWEHQGNDDHFMAPHGVYPCTGSDQWVAIACSDDNQWAALARLLAVPDLATLTLTDRLGRRRELDALVSRWTADRTSQGAAAELQQAGVAAHGVQNSPECSEDPQLRHRGWLTDATHTLLGHIPIGTTPIRLSRTPARLDAAGPLLGEHTFPVLTDLLGYDDDLVTELVVSEIFR